MSDKHSSISTRARDSRVGRSAQTLIGVVLMSGGWRFFLMSLPAPLAIGFFTCISFKLFELMYGITPEPALLAGQMGFLPAVILLLILQGVFFSALAAGIVFSGKWEFSRSRLLRSAIGSTFYLFGLLAAWKWYHLSAGMALILGLTAVFGMHRALGIIIARQRGLQHEQV